MRWCNVQTNEHDLQAKTYPTICTHHKLHNNVDPMNLAIRECLIAASCLLSYHMIWGRSKGTSKLRVTGLCAGNSPVTVNSPRKWPVTRKMFPFDDVIMDWNGCNILDSAVVVVYHKEMFQQGAKGFYKHSSWPPRSLQSTLVISWSGT